MDISNNSRFFMVEAKMPQESDSGNISSEHQKRGFIEGEVLTKNDTLEEDTADLTEESAGISKLKTNLDAVLKEAGISWQQFYLFLACGVIFIIALIVSAYFLIKIFSQQIQDEPEPEASKPVMVQPKLNVKSGLIGGTRLAFQKPQIYSGLERSLQAGVLLTERLFTLISGSVSVSSVSLLQALNVVLDIDIATLLDQSSDRERALEDYLNQLKDLQKKTQEIREALVLEMGDFKTEFETVSSQKEIQEKAFFDNLALFLPRETDQALGEFLNLVSKQSVLKAKFNAHSKTKSYLDNRFKRLEARIQGIELNKEALILGIKIVPVKGADLDLVENVP